MNDPRNIATLDRTHHDNTPVDLSPAEWIWHPSERTLPNTVVRFRKHLQLECEPERVTGWVTADSRYRFSVDGDRVQWGPPPCDPRSLEVDPIDLTDTVEAGSTVLGAEVLHYGHGDGTWPIGKPGFLCWIEIEYPDGTQELCTSDRSWQCQIDRSHPPGQHKRFFLRSLQEVVDERQADQNWCHPEYDASDWLTPAVIDCPPDKPVSSAKSHAIQRGDDRTDPDTIWRGFDRSDPDKSSLLARQIPLLETPLIDDPALVNQGTVQWHRDPEEWFQQRTPDSLETIAEPVVTPTEGGYRVTPEQGNGVFLTFEFDEQLTGWPVVEIDAEAGTTVELLCQEAHDPEETNWLDTHHFAWSRLITDGGTSRFDAFDWESLRFIQLHIHDTAEPVTIRTVGVRRRIFPMEQTPKIECSDEQLQSLFDAGLNMIRNSAQETIIDGGGRERQQYSGDCGHQLHTIREFFGTRSLPNRFIRTYAEGQTKQGYFLDCWPGYDRMARLATCELDSSLWGPLLDHGIGFCFDCYHHYRQTGDAEIIADVYPQLRRFCAYLFELQSEDGYIPVDLDIVPDVWMDHDGFDTQREKECSFNLYLAAMLEHALAPLAELQGDVETKRRVTDQAETLVDTCIDRYWDDELELFVDNHPWDDAEDPSLHDRTLATAVLFDYAPVETPTAMLDALEDPPENMGLSYPPNAPWRYWALAKHGRIDAVAESFRTRWATMESVEKNNSIAEFWEPEPDTTDTWSHCPVAPLLHLHQDIIGIRPNEAGYESVEWRPQPIDVEELHVEFSLCGRACSYTQRRDGGQYELALSLPPDLGGSMILPSGAVCAPDHGEAEPATGGERQDLPAGGTEVALPIN